MIIWLSNPGRYRKLIKPTMRFSGSRDIATIKSASVCFKNPCLSKQLENWPLSNQMISRNTKEIDCLLIAMISPLISSPLLNYESIKHRHWMRWLERTKTRCKPKMVTLYYPVGQGKLFLGSVSWRRSRNRPWLSAVATQELNNGRGR